jgi:ribosomal subunit interface protein
MELPLQITFRNMDSSEAIAAKIRERAAKLDRYHDHIMSCRVVVEAPHRHHLRGHLYHVRVDVTVPNGELLVTRDPPQHEAHKDVYVAIRDAFDAAARQLEDYARRQQGRVKVHEAPPEARIARLFLAEGYGFIETPDGREVYFHKNSVIGERFDRLEVGREVRFVEEQGENGPQASTVRVGG